MMKTWWWVQESLPIPSDPLHWMPFQRRFSSYFSSLLNFRQRMTMQCNENLGFTASSSRSRKYSHWTKRIMNLPLEFKK
jgi:hypothetical protein